MEYKIGMKIKVIYMEGEPQYTGKTGVINCIDDIGQLHGSWGGCAVIPEVDIVEVIDDSDKQICCICGKEFYGFGNNAEPVASGICCDGCNYNKVIPARFEEFLKEMEK